MKRIKFSLAFAVLFLSSAVVSDKLKLVSFQYPPYIFQDENGTVTGIVYDVVQEVFDRLGYASSTRIYAWPRSLELVKVGEADAIYTAYKNPEREQFLDYSNSVIMPQEVVFFVHEDSDIDFDGDLTKLKGRRIATVREISYGSIFDRAIEKGVVQVEPATLLEQSVLKFAAGRVDMIISNKYTAYAMFRKLGLQGKFKELNTPVQKVPSYIAFSKENELTNIRNEFDRVFDEVVKDGTYDKLISFYIE